MCLCAHCCFFHQLRKCEWRRGFNQLWQSCSCHLFVPPSATDGPSEIESSSGNFPKYRTQTQQPPLGLLVWFFLGSCDVICLIVIQSSCSLCSLTLSSKTFIHIFIFILIPIIIFSLTFIYFVFISFFILIFIFIFIFFIIFFSLSSSSSSSSSKSLFLSS